MQKTNALLVAALSREKVKQHAIDTLTVQQQVYIDHISSQDAIIQDQNHHYIALTEQLASRDTRITILEQNNTDLSSQLVLLQQIIDRMNRASLADQRKLEKQSKELLKMDAIRHGRNQLAKDRYGRKSEKTHGKTVIPGALAFRGDMSPEERACMKELFDNTGYAILEKRDRRCPSLIEQGVKVETMIIDLNENDMGTGYRRIGENIVEKVCYEKPRVYIKRYIQYVYLVPDAEKGETYFKNVSAPMPADLLRNKCSADVTLLVQLLLDKYLYALPLYRQAQRFEQAGCRIPHSSLSDWTAKAAKSLLPLYDIMLREMIKCGLLHLDETGMLVIDKSKDTGRKSHRGYLIAMLNPLLNFACFKYAKGRGHKDMEPLLHDFRGFLHTDALGTYSKYGNLPGVQHGLCFTHARRGMQQARDNDIKRAAFALSEFINPLYAIERKCRSEHLDFDQVTAMRQKYSVPILDAFHKWLLKEQPKVIPRSAIANAIGYFLNNWKGLTLFAADGMLSLDNNILERQIRTIAVARKNFMFAGSHNAAQLSAVVYTFIASCKLQNIDPESWFTDVFHRLPKQPVDKLADLLPQHWKKAA